MKSHKTIRVTKKVTQIPAFSSKTKCQKKKKKDLRPISLNQPALVNADCLQFQRPVSLIIEYGKFALGFMIGLECK